MPAARWPLELYADPIVSGIRKGQVEHSGNGTVGSRRSTQAASVSCCCWVNSKRRGDEEESSNSS